LVGEAVSIVRVLAEDKQQTLSIHAEDTGELAADSSFLHMAVVNLLDNAVKYSPECSAIHVTVRPQNRAHAEGRFLEIIVADEGPGIPEGARELVFNRFYRVDESRNREAGGVGLGLAIAKWAVEAHGGSILVESGPRGGAMFSISLPIASAGDETKESNMKVS
jgi:signal transduction histidine kinase